MSQKNWQKDLAKIWKQFGFSYAHDTMARKVEGVFKKHNTTTKNKK